MSTANIDPLIPSVQILEGEYAVWAALHGVSLGALRQAIAEVGNHAAKVRAFLDLRGTRSGRGAASAMSYLQREGAPATDWSVVPQLLRLIKIRLEKDVAFVSQFVDGTRVFRWVDVPTDAQVIAVGGSDPLEASWCQKVVDGRLPQAIPDAAVLQAEGVLPATPFPIGTHLSAPILMRDGSVYGTLCCFSFAASPRAAHDDLELLRAAALLLAERLQDGKLHRF